MILLCLYASEWAPKCPCFWHSPSLSSGSLLRLQPVDSSRRHAWRGQGQTCPLCLNKSYFKCSRLRVVCFRPAAILGLKPPVSLWQVQWLWGCGSRPTTWSRILSGTWWLGTGAAYLTESLTGCMVAGSKREGGRRAWEQAMSGWGGGGEGLTEEQLKDAAAKKGREKEGRVWEGQHSWQADERKEAKVRVKRNDMKKKEKKRKKWGIKKRWDKVKWMRQGEKWEAKTWSKTYGWGRDDEQSEGRAHPWN